jgi:hypothetical protein
VVLAAEIPHPVSFASLQDENSLDPDPVPVVSRPLTEDGVPEILDPGDAVLGGQVLGADKDLLLRGNHSSPDSHILKMVCSGS